MKIGLLAVNGHNFPNLALMKLSAWHKAQGDTVELARSFGHYDQLYKSKVFTFSTERTFLVNADRIIKGGTGYRDYTTSLPHEIEEIIRRGIKVDFNQGLDARIIANNPDVARLLARVKWMQYIRMAYDHAANEEPVMRAIENPKEAGVKPYKMFFYVLVKDVADAERRIEQLRTAGAQPFAQPYRDFENNIRPTQEQKRLARWCNHKAIFKSIKFSEYK